MRLQASRVRQQRLRLAAAASLYRAPSDATVATGPAEAGHYVLSKCARAGRRCRRLRSAELKRESDAAASQPCSPATPPAAAAASLYRAPSDATVAAGPAEAGHYVI